MWIGVLFEYVWIVQEVNRSVFITCEIIPKRCQTD